MPVVILLAFNGFVLFLILRLFFGSYHPSYFEQSLFAVTAFFIVVGLSFLCDSPAGQWLLRLIAGARNAIGREQAKLGPIIAQVQENIKERIGLSPMAIQLMVIDDPLPNATAIGRNTLIVSRALYETANDDELAGMIAHEFGHLHNGDSRRLGIALGVSLVSLTIAMVAGVILSFCGGLTKNAGKAKELGVVMLILSTFFGVLAGFFWVFVKIGNGVLQLVMLFVGRKQEYEADKFAVKAGYGPGVLSLLDKIKNIQFGTQKNIFARLYETHPPIMLRIGELEKIMEVER